MSILSQILENRIVAIIRGAHATDVVKIAEALYAGGIRILEVTMNSEDPLKVIRELNETFGDRMIIGAGTVLDAQTVEKAVKAGARFIVSPAVDPQVIEAAKHFGVGSIPGAYTATEIYQAYQLGADIVKVFPALSPSYIKAIAGPLPQVPLLPTGGITLENIRDFKNAGAVGFGLGSALVNTQQEITQQYLLSITSKAKQFVLAVAN